MKVLVTGSAGFVGTNLIKLIKKERPNWEVWGIDNYTTGTKENHVNGVLYLDNNTWDLYDHRMEPRLHFSREPFDIIFHFGEYSRIVKSFDDRDRVMKSNLYGTTQILKYCLDNGSKLIYSASSSKFGNDGDDENLTPYSWTKAKMVELIKNYHNWFGLQYEICYFYNVYGPHQIKTGDYATVLGIFEDQYQNNQPITVVEPGTQSRDFTHVDDIVSGVLKTVDKSMNREWFLRSGVSYELIKVAKMFSNNIEMLPFREGERHSSVDTENDDTVDVLGWKPKHNLKDWVKEIKK
jgi:UDP-glucose 4-epimerase